RRKSDSAIIAPSRIHERAYDLVPGRSIGPSRVISTCESAVRSVSSSERAGGGACTLTRLSVLRHADATAFSSRCNHAAGASPWRFGATVGPDHGTTTP